MTRTATVTAAPKSGLVATHHAAPAEAKGPLMLFPPRHYQDSASLRRQAREHRTPLTGSAARKGEPRADARNWRQRVPFAVPPNCEEVSYDAQLVNSRVERVVVDRGVTMVTPPSEWSLAAQVHAAFADPARVGGVTMAAGPRRVISRDADRVACGLSLTKHSTVHLQRRAGTFPGFLPHRTEEPPASAPLLL
jgi:hypothetical protein